MYSRFLVLVLLCRLEHVPGASYPTVTTEDGTIRGIYTQSREGRIIPTFLGVRYCKAPIGKLRFQNAQPIGPWEGEMVADAMPPACMQIKSMLNVGLNSEDCLFLNIFTPNLKADPLLPVMVWIFGGGNEHGTIGSYTPEYMMDGGTVLVVPQYRLGMLGFLSTGDSVLPGNQGLKDIRQALRWVQKNIKHFGGDPSKVTIFGESSGAACVHALMLYCSNDGLFRAGISQSGTSLVGFNFMLPTQIRDLVRELAILVKCPLDNKGFADCMINKASAKDIVNAFQKYQMLTSIGSLTKGFFPMPGIVLEPDCVEDRIVTANPWTLTVSLPWIVGNNEKEGLAILSPIIEDRTEMRFKVFARNYNKLLTDALNCKFSSADCTQIGPATKKFYLHDKSPSREIITELCDGITDSFFKYCSWESMSRSNRSQTYVYILKYKGVNQVFPVPMKDEDIIGASHGSEAFFFFPHPFNLTDTHIYSAEDEKKSKELVTLWTNFAKELNPTPTESELGYIWKPYGPDESYLEIGQESTSMKNSFLPGRMDFWRNLPYPLRDDKLEPVPCFSKRK